MTDDVLIPGCGGLEQPFTVNGRRWLYCWHPASGRHCYLDMDNDVAVWHRLFHPVDSPEFEFIEETEITVPLRDQQIQAHEDLYF